MSQSINSSLRSASEQVFNRVKDAGAEGDLIILAAESLSLKASEGTLEEQELAKLVNSLHVRLASLNPAMVYDVGFWQEHFVAVSKSLEAAENKRFKATGIHYLQQLKRAVLQDTLQWVVGDLLDAITSDSYDFVAAICRGASQSIYIPLHPEHILWMAIERLMSGKASQEADAVQLSYVYTVLNLVNEVDSPLAHDTLEAALAYDEQEAQAYTALAEVPNVLTSIGMLSMRWPGFTQLHLPVIDTSEHVQSIQDFAANVTRNVTTYYRAVFTGQAPKSESDSE